MLQVILTFSDSIFQHRNHVYILYTKIQQYDVYKISIHVLFKLYTKKKCCSYILYTKCIQKFVEMWNTVCIHFVYTNSDLQ